MIFKAKLLPKSADKYLTAYDELLPLFLDPDAGSILCAAKGRCPSAWPG